MDSPPLSVVMPVHNALPFLDASISSILNQTFPDFDFVILNDASTDGSDRVLREWEKRDRRIRVIESDRKLGLAGSSNLVVSTSVAKIVARMDADDISHPDRLKRQLEIMTSHPDVVVVGTLRRKHAGQCLRMDMRRRVTSWSANCEVYVLIEATRWCTTSSA
jgi:glycosyltransferase involved in cell wall biosynthesis